MLINISEEVINKGIKAIMEAATILPKSDIVNNMAILCHELTKEKLKSIEIELQCYDDVDLLTDCLLDPTLNITDNPNEVLPVNF